MKKISILLISLLILGLLNSKIPEIKNDAEPEVERIAVKLIASHELSDEIDAFQEFILIEDKLILCSMQSKMVWIMNLKGELIKLLDTMGSGPGEFSMPARVFDDSKFNRFGVIDQMNRRTSYFDYEVNYLEDVGFEGLTIPFSKDYVNDMIIDFSMIIDIDQEKGSIMTKPTIKLIRDEEETILFQNAFNPLEMNISESKIPIFDYSLDNIYITTTTPGEYLIQVFDYTGEHVRDISKKYKKIKLSDEDIEELENRLEDIKKQIGSHGADIEFKDYEFESAIANMITDPEGRLWIQTQNEKSDFFDIIDDTGKIVAQCFFNEPEIYLCRFHEDNLYEISGDEDDGYTLKIYEVEK